MQQQQNRPSGGNDDNGNETKTTWIAVASTAVLVFIIIVPGLGILIHDRIPDTAKAFEVFVASVFSLALVIVVIIQAGIYFRQAKALDPIEDFRGYPQGYGRRFEEYAAGLRKHSGRKCLFPKSQASSCSSGDRKFWTDSC
jgi:hypothetical protein